MYNAAEDAKRVWWWSPLPPWKYLVNVQGYPPDSAQGWGNFIALHPGLFNLAWLASGVELPPDDFVAYADKIRWVLCDARAIPMGDHPMAHWAFHLDLRGFHDKFVEERAMLLKWKFREGEASYGRILTMLGDRLRTRA